MTTAFDRVQEGLAMAFCLQIWTMFIVDRAELKSRMVGILGYARRIPLIWSGPAVNRAFWMLYMPWVGVSVVGDFAGMGDTHPHVPWALWQKVVFGLFAVAVASFAVVATIWIRRRRRQAKMLPLSRGVLWESVRKMARKVRISELIGGAGIFVLPDMSRALRLGWPGTTVLIPRQLLDSMSRREIDALAARQLCLQSKQYFYPPFWTLLACNAAVVCLLEWLVASATVRSLGLLPLLAAQIVALRFYLPGALTQADFRAVEMTGDPEVFLSSMAALSRFSGTPINEPLVTEVARRSGISVDRIPDLLAERIVPEEDRYPTSGSYLTTGL